MKCKKCDGKLHIQQEWEIRGTFWTVHCINCGWYGPIIKDERKMIDMSKRGICRNFTEPIIGITTCPSNGDERSLPSHDLCGTCYNAVRASTVCPYDYEFGKDFKKQDKCRLCNLDSYVKCQKAHAKLEAEEVKCQKAIEGDIKLDLNDEKIYPDNTGFVEEAIKKVETEVIERVKEFTEEMKEEQKPKKVKQPILDKCFFCGEEHERTNQVGYIKFNDGEHERNIFVCHYCSSRCFEDILNTDIDIKTVLGKLMFNRALDSRSW